MLAVLTLNPASVFTLAGACFFIAVAAACTVAALTNAFAR